MGSQVESYSISVNKLIQEWQVYRRVLNKENQIYFDKFFSLAVQNAHAGNALASPFPMEVVTASVIIELIRENHKLKDNIENLEKRMDKMMEMINKESK